MKRIATLVLLAALFGSRGEAADLPLPTGLAPTSPSVPAPIFAGGVPTAEQASFREKLGLGASYEMPAEESVAGPRKLIGSMNWRPCRDCALFAKPDWCENCAPLVKRPLPPLPAGLSTRPCATGNGEAATRAKASGSCCEKLKNWLCFHYTPVRMPLIPTPKQPGLWTYFPTRDGPGVCANGNCATGHCGGKARMGTAAGCVPCPAPGDAIVPGYRLANPEK